MTRARITADTVREWGRRYSNWGRWGPEDELGALNFVTRERVLAATALPRRGEVVSCALAFDDKGKLTLDEVNIDEATLRSIDKIIVIACGTAAYAGHVARSDLRP